MPPLQVEDIQGIILYGYGRLQSACFLLLQLADRSAARAWLAVLEVQSARCNRDELDRSVNIAFTRAGLERLRLHGTWIGEFAGEFGEGMTATKHRQRILGDVGERSPE